MTDLACIRLPAAHELALLASRAAVDFDFATRRDYRWDRIRQLGGVLSKLSTTTTNFGAWLSDAGEAVHRALDPALKVGAYHELRDELLRVTGLFASASEDSAPMDLEQLREFSLALSRAAQRAAAYR